MVEMQIINKHTIPHKEKWTDLLKREFANFVPGADAIRLTFKKDEAFAGTVTAWRRICTKNHKKARVKVKPHVLGNSVWLWYE